MMITYLYDVFTTYINITALIEMNMQVYCRQNYANILYALYK